MKQKQSAIYLILFCILLLRLSPLVFLYSLESNIPIKAGDIDSSLYFWGAQKIIAAGTNTINSFPPLNFLFISTFLYLGNGHVIPPVVAIAVVGWLTVVGIYLLAKTLFDERAALIAAVISGLYPNFIFYGVSLYAETLAVFWIVASFFAIAKYFGTSKTFYLLLAGISWGLASQTRGGLHYFPVCIAVIILGTYFRQGWRFSLKSLSAFLVPTYLTFFAIGIITSPIQGNSFNSASGINAVVIGANRIASPCTDYGDVNGSLWYVDQSREDWPKGSLINLNDDINESQILDKVVAFVLQDPMLYMKNSFRKLSCLWSSNQYVIFYLKLRSTYSNFIGPVCFLISLLYVIVVLFGGWGITMGKDPFRMIFISFILYYCALIFLAVGNSKLRFPMMPLFIIYCSYFISCIGLKHRMRIKSLRNKWIIIILIIFACNSIYKYMEISLSPTEIHVRKIERCNELGFTKTVLSLLGRNKKHNFTEAQEKRIRTAEELARRRMRILSITEMNRDRL
jgi:4-amino-4-deoxy-L-arabinose transferase-like glycosyltransferase